MASYVLNGTEYEIDSEDPDLISAAVSDIKASQEDLPEIFNASMNPRELENPEGVDPVKARMNATGMALSGATTSQEQARIIHKNHPEAVFNIDDEGRLLVNMPNQPGENGTVDNMYGYVNKPGLSSMDISQTMSLLAVGVAGSTPAGKVPQLGKLITAGLRSVVSAGSEAGVEVARQQLMDILGPEKVAGIPDDQIESAAQVVLAGLFGFGAELAGPALSFLYNKVIRNPKYIQGNSLTAKGEDVIRELGIDPAYMTPDIIHKMKGVPTARFDEAAVHAVASTNPELLARVGLTGKAGVKGEGATAALQKFASARDLAKAEVNEQYKKARSYNIKLPTSSADSFLDDLANILVSEKGVDLDSGIVADKFKLLEKRLTGVQSSNPTLSRTTARRANTDINATVRGYDSFRRNINAEIRSLRRTNPEDASLPGLLEMKTQVDGYIDDLVETGLRNVDPRAITELKRANYVNKQVAEKYDTSDNVLIALARMDGNSPLTPEELSNTLLGMQSMGGKGVPQAVVQLKKVLGEDSLEFLALKDEVFRGMTNTGTAFSPTAFSKRWSEFKTENSSLSKAIFTPEDIKAIDDLADHSKNKINFVQGVGDFLTVRYGVHGAAVAGSIRRLAHMRDAILGTKERSIFSKVGTAFAVPLAEASSKKIEDDEHFNRLFTGRNKVNSERTPAPQEQ